jgi:hypothetical protein
VVPDDHRLADDLDRYWDATLRGEAPARPGGIDEISAAIIARLREPTESRYLADAQQRVRQQVVESTTTVRPPVIPSPESDLENRERMSRLNVRGAPRTVLILAATILLALGVALAIDILREPNPDHGGGPAIHAPATPTPETVLEITLPATALPTGDGVGAGLAVFTIAPGTRSTWDQTCCPGVLVEYVLSGQYTVRSQAAITVVRASGAAEEVPARTEVVLNPGDSLISRDEVGVEAANTGTEPVALLSWLLITGDGTFNSRVQLPMWDQFGPQFTGHKLPGWVEGLPGDVREMADVQGPIMLDAAPATIQLRRVTLPDNSTVSLPADGLQFVAPVGPHADKLRQADHTLRILGEIGQPVTVYILTLHQGGP